MRFILVSMCFAACAQPEAIETEETPAESFALASASKDVYISSLVNGFTSTSWSGNYTFTGGFITAQVTSAWGALALRASANTPVSDYSTLSFDIRGATGAQVYITLEPETGNPIEEPAITLSSAWTEHDIPVGNIDSGLANFRTILFKSATAQTFYVDNVRLNVPPTVATLTATPFTTSSTLSWTTTGSVRQTKLNTVVTPSDGTEVVNATGAYTVQVIGLGGTGSRSVNVAPRITAFAASPSTITQGASSTLTWTTVGTVTTLTLDGASTPNDGTQSVTPSATKTYTLVATGPGGSATATVTVTVNAAPSAPTIPTFTATPASITQGASSTLQWTTTGTITSATLNSVSTANDGAESVSPSATTTYTLVVTGPGGSANKQVTVTVTAPPSGTRAVFTDSYQNGFSNTNVWFNQYSATGGSVYLKGTSAWQGLELTTSSPFAASSYTQLQVRARGTGTFAIEGTGSAQFTLSSTDNTFSLPVSALWPSGNISKFYIKNVTANAEMWIDWIQFAGACSNALPPSPLTVHPGSIDTFSVGGVTHWVSTPATYDATCHSAPKKLFVWLHGCGGHGSDDIGEVMPKPGEDWIALAVGGAEGACWPSSSNGQAQTIVMNAINNLKTRLAIKNKEVIIGGYSSGGDVGYPIIFNNANTFALALFENTAPWGDNGQSSALLNAAAWDFPIRHLCHESDDIWPYRCDQLNPILGPGGRASAAGHSSVLHRMDGTHWQNEYMSGGVLRGTWPDFNAALRPYLSQTFVSP